MGISGNLKTMALAELLQWLSQGQKTGTLVIDGGKIQKRIFFEEGVIVSSASTDPKEYLGAFLTAHGYITEDEANGAVARQKQEKQLLGQILVGMGSITEEQLQEVLRQKAEESIYDVFTWEAGEFVFLDDEMPAETFIRMSLDVQWIVLEGSRRLDEWRRVREWVPSPLAVPVIVADFASLDIDEVDKRILEWIDDDRTVEDISQGAQTSLFMIAQTVARYVEQGVVKVVRPRVIEVEVPGYDPPSGAQPVFAQGGAASVNVGGRTLHFAGGGPPGAAVAVAPPQTEAEVLLEKGDEELRRGELREALATYRRAKTAEGVGPSVRQAVEEGEMKVAEALERDGVKLSAVPKLKCKMEQLTQLQISPQEGFMLTRIDGSYDIKSILKMSPMPELDARMFFWTLKKSGHVAL